MTISEEKPVYRWAGRASRRRDRRLEMPPIQIVIDDGTYETTNWSLGGFLIGSYTGRRGVGEETTVEIVVVVGPRRYVHRVAVEIVRVFPAVEELAAQFVKLDPAALDTLEGWMTGRLRRQNHD